MPDSLGPPARHSTDVHIRMYNFLRGAHSLNEAAAARQNSGQVVDADEGLEIGREGWASVRGLGQLEGDRIGQGGLAAGVSSHRTPSRLVASGRASEAVGAGI